jgi:hypothetical protein
MTLRILAHVGDAFIVGTSKGHVGFISEQVWNDEELTEDHSLLIVQVRHPMNQYKVPLYSPPSVAPDPDTMIQIEEKLVELLPYVLGPITLRAGFLGVTQTWYIREVRR